MQKMPRRLMRYAKDAPRFTEAVRKARRDAARTGAAPTVRETLDAFEDDPFVLYACLWYAHGRGVSVTFEAPRDGGNPQPGTAAAPPPDPALLPPGPAR